MLDGLPAGELGDEAEIALQMARRAPGRDKTATRRREDDQPCILAVGTRTAHHRRPPAMIIRKQRPASPAITDLNVCPGYWGIPDLPMTLQ